MAHIVVRRHALQALPLPSLGMHTVRKQDGEKCGLRLGADDRLCGDFRPRQQLSLCVDLVQANLVAPGLLGRVHRRIGTVQQRIPLQGMVGVQRHTTTGNRRSSFYDQVNYHIKS